MAASTRLSHPFPSRPVFESAFGQAGSLPDRPFGPPVLNVADQPGRTRSEREHLEHRLAVGLPPCCRAETVSISRCRCPHPGERLEGPIYVVVGLTMDTIAQTESTLIVAEFGIGCALLNRRLPRRAGGRAAGGAADRTGTPRAAKFTADASHELRHSAVGSSRPRRAWPWRRERRRNLVIRKPSRRIDSELRPDAHTGRRHALAGSIRFDRGQPDAEPSGRRVVLAAQTTDRLRGGGGGRRGRN